MEPIGETVRLIDGIASQADHLTLDAGIEAARAGEHGHGAAVVAVELEKLAGRRRHAAGEIDRMAPVKRRVPRRPLPDVA